MKTNNPRPFPRRLLPLTYLACFAYLMLGLASCSPYLGGKPPQIVTLTLTPSNLVLNLEGSTNITAQLDPTNTADTNLTWTSSRPDVATVSNGLITARYGGTATITATHGSGAVAMVEVTVLQPATSFTLSPTNFTLGVGGSRTIAVQFFPTNANTNTNITWVSRNPTVATVIDGVVTGIFSGGPVTITASNTIEVTATVTVKVLSTPNLSYRGVGCPADSSQLTLTWDAVPGVTRYEVYSNKAPIPITNTTNNFLNLPESTPGDYLFQVKACDGEGCSQSASLTATVTTKEKSFSSLITSGNIPSDLSGYGISQTIFSNYPAGATVVARYVKEGGDGNGDGITYATAASNVKTVLDGITDASASNVYAVLIAPGTYDAGAEMGMKNHVAIIGGQCSVEPAGNTPSVLSGGKAHRVFNNSGITNTALLYGVTIADGSTTGDGGGMYSINSFPVLIRVTFSGNTADGNWPSGGGGGMFNSSSSPVLIGVTLSGNTANKQGGGMYNTNASPVLTGVTLSGNTAGFYGGGMYNSSSFSLLTGVTLSGNKAHSGGGMYNSSSSPLLTGVTLSGNEARYYGGGMYNSSSSPLLTGVTLSGNTAGNGGGMYNDSSFPLLTGVTLSGNTAGYGGGMYNKNDGQVGPRLVNTIIWGNRATIGTGTGAGNQIYILNDKSDQENLHLYHSLIQDGLPTGYISGTSTTNFNGGGFASGNGSGGNAPAPIVVTFSSIITVDPGLLPLADNGGDLLTHAIPASSSAVNQGLYVRRSGDTFYYSTDNSNWYSDLELTTTATPPADAVDLTATDATGRNRTDRPDIGAYEAR